MMDNWLEDHFNLYTLDESMVPVQVGVDKFTFPIDIAEWHYDKDTWVSTKFFGMETKKHPKVMEWTFETAIFIPNSVTRTMRAKTYAHALDNHKEAVEWAKKIIRKRDEGS